MKKMMRIISILTMAALLLTILSCGGSSSNNDNTEKIADNDINAAEQNEQKQQEEKIDVHSVLANLPSEDYGGYEFRIMTTNWYNPTVEARQAPEEEQNGDPINDALYLRDKLIEEKYNINIKYSVEDDDWTLLTKAQNAIKAGDDAFDFVMDNLRVVTSGLAQIGALIDFNIMPNVDLTNEWWSKYAIRDLTINGKFYFPTGDITARYMLADGILMFNKTVFRDMGIEYPYKSVIDGNWTLDEFMNLIRGKTRDLNGDGKIDKDNDFYGLIVYNQAAFDFMLGSGEGLIKIVDGNPVINVKNERTVTIMEKVATLWNDEYNPYTVKVYYEEIPMFIENRAMFLQETIADVSLFRDMDSDFGIIPLPKWDKNQTDYFSHANPSGTSAVCVPVTNPNIERTGMIIEALAAAGKYTSTPAVYDITLKTKFARDPESEIMLDLICEGSRYDFAKIYNWGDLYTQFCSNVGSGKSFIAPFEKIEGKVQKDMEKTIKAFEHD